MGTPWSDANIIRYLVMVTLDLVGRQTPVAVRYEALIVAMHAAVRITMSRFGDRAPSLISGYFSEMQPHLVGAGLPAGRIEDHIQRRFAEYDRLLSKVAQDQSFALTEMAMLFAGHTAGCKPEEVGWNSTMRWQGFYIGFQTVIAGFIDETILRPGIMARLWRGLRMIFRED